MIVIKISRIVFFITYFEIRLKFLKARNKMSEIIKKFNILNELKVEFLNKIKFLYVFKDFSKNSNVFIATNDDKVYALGNNSNGVLGFGNYKFRFFGFLNNLNFVNQLTHNEELSYKQIIDFNNGDCHVIALTIDGKVYCWGYNKSGVIGKGKNYNITYKQKLNEYLIEKQIIDICCGDMHNIVLTHSGEVYAWGYNNSGQIGNGDYVSQFKPIKLNHFNNEKVVMISCVYEH